MFKYVYFANVMCSMHFSEFIAVYKKCVTVASHVVIVTQKNYYSV